MVGNSAKKKRQPTNSYPTFPNCDYCTLLEDCCKAVRTSFLKKKDCKWQNMLEEPIYTYFHFMHPLLALPTCTSY